MDKQQLIILVLACIFYNNVQAHMSIWVPSMWGSEPDNINANWAVQPLQDQPFSGWWMHGTKSINDPPPGNAITQLPAGGTLDFEITGNKAFTSMGRGLWVKPGSGPRDVPDPWTNDMGGYGSSNIHAPAHKDVAGCALGIAYKSDINSVQPEDFVIFSVVHDCIARQLQAFDIPTLPACPNGKCVCSWFWVHNSIGGTDQMYMTAFQCNVTNPSKRTLGKPVPPVRCDGQMPCYLYPNWGNKTNTCPKAKQPIYWANNERNNVANPTNWQCAPIYNSPYGFQDGAQKEIFSDSFEELPGSIGDTLISKDLDISVIHSSPDTILVSPSSATKLVVQDDGDIVLSDVSRGKIYWNSNTAGVNGVAPYHLTMQNDGNLVLSDDVGSVFWTSNTANKGTAPYRLKLRDLVSLSVVDRDGYTLWSAL
jgi:hypothetical protein